MNISQQLLSPHMNSVIRKNYYFMKRIHKNGINYKLYTDEKLKNKIPVEGAEAGAGPSE